MTPLSPPTFQSSAAVAVTLTALTLSYIYLKKSKSKAKLSHQSPPIDPDNHSDDVPSDPHSTPLQALFHATATKLKNFSPALNLSTSDLLALYSLYKTATLTDVKDMMDLLDGKGKPSVLYYEARAKWEGRRECLVRIRERCGFGDDDVRFDNELTIVNNEAQSMYIDCVNDLIAESNSANPNNSAKEQDDGISLGAAQQSTLSISQKNAQLLDESKWELEEIPAILQLCMSSDLTSDDVMLASEIEKLLAGYVGSDNGISMYEYIRSCEDSTKSTALHYASDTGCIRTCKTLLKYDKLSLTHTDTHQETTTAAQYANLQDITGMTPLHNAAINGHADILKLLIEHGGDVGVCDYEGGSVREAGDGEEGVLEVLDEFERNLNSGE